MTIKTFTERLRCPMGDATIPVTWNAATGKADRTAFNTHMRTHKSYIKSGLTYTPISKPTPSVYTKIVADATFGEILGLSSAFIERLVMTVNCKVLPEKMPLGGSVNIIPDVWVGDNFGRGGTMAAPNRRFPKYGAESVPPGGIGSPPVLTSTQFYLIPANAEPMLASVIGVTTSAELVEAVSIENFVIDQIEYRGR